MSDTIADKIEENAKSPAKVSVDGMAVDALSIDQQILADKYLAAKNAATKNHCGLTFRQLTPGGCG